MAGGTVYLSRGGLGDSLDVDWDGTSDGARLPDGTYTYRLSAADGLGGVVDRTARVRIDTAPPVATLARGTSASATLSPNGDGAGDAWTGTLNVNEGAFVDAAILGGDGTVVRHLSASSAAGTVKMTWDGRSDGGGGVADGRYVVTLRVRDAAGNVANGPAVTVTVYRALSRVTASTSLFYPQDGDRYAPSTALGFTLLAPATVTWTVADAKGRTVATRFARVPLAAGGQAWTWAGIDSTGARVAAGAYTAILTATNGTLSVTSRSPLTVAAFRTTVNPTVATRGRSITVTAVSAEPLAATPRLTISQPGVASRTVPMVKVATNTYRTTTRLSASGRSGTLGLKISGIDAGRGTNVGTASVTLR